MTDMSKYLNASIKMQSVSISVYHAMTMRKLIGSICKRFTNIMFHRSRHSPHKIEREDVQNHQRREYCLVYKKHARINNPSAININIRRIWTTIVKLCVQSFVAVDSRASIKRCSHAASSKSFRRPFQPSNTHNDCPHQLCD